MWVLSYCCKMNFLFKAICCHFPVLVVSFLFVFSGKNSEGEWGAAEDYWYSCWCNRNCKFITVYIFYHKSSNFDVLCNCSEFWVIEPLDDNHKLRNATRWLSRGGAWLRPKWAMAPCSLRFLKTCAYQMATTYVICYISMLNNTLESPEAYNLGQYTWSSLFLVRTYLWCSLRLAPQELAQASPLISFIFMSC